MKIGTENASLFSRTPFQLNFQANESENAKRASTGNAGGLKKASLFDFSQLSKNASDARKAAAWTRMAQLKAQLEALMKSSMGSVNPLLIAQYGSSSGGSAAPSPVGGLPYAHLSPQ